MVRRMLVGSLAVLAVISACSSNDKPASNNGSLPDAAGLLRDSAAATKNIKSAHFLLKANGEIPGIPVHSAEGDLTKEGAAKGKINMDLLGQLFEGEFVLVNQSIYIKGATGNYQKLPASLISNLYDPGAILDPNRGIAKVLSSVKDARTEGREQTEGADTYKVSGRVAKDVVSGLVPGVNSDVDITFWLRQDNKQPVKATVKMPGGNGKDATVDVTLSNVDESVSITPPA
jgi:lipoprotein LprG